MPLRFLQSIFSAGHEPGKFDKETMLAAIERVVDGTDARLRAVSHYRRLLWNSVECAIDFVVTFVNALPPAIPADRQGYMADPRLRALFASPDSMLEKLSFNEGTQSYLKQRTGPPPPEVYAALGAARVEKNVLGIDLDGDVLQREVAQTVVNFCDHRLIGQADNEQDTRRELMKRAFDYLIETALLRLATGRARRTRLEQRQQRLLQQKTGLLRTAKLGLDVLAGPAGQEPTDLIAVEHQLQDLETELSELRADSATLEHHLARVAATLSEPRRYLGRESVSLTLDHMNIKVPPSSNRVANTLTLDEVLLGKDLRLAALLVRFPRQEILPQPDFFDEAERLLNANR